MLQDELIRELERQERDFLPSDKELIDQILDTVEEGAHEGEVVDIIEFVRAEWGLNENPFPIQRFLLKLIFGIPLDDRPDDLVREVLSPTQFVCSRAVQFGRSRTVDIGDNLALHVSQVNSYRGIVTLDSEPDYPIQIGDWVTSRIEVWDKFKENLEGTYTEAEFFDFIYGDGPGTASCRISLSRQEFNQRLGKQMNLVIARIGRRGAKCVDENTLCHTSQGLLTLKEMAPHELAKESPRVKAGIEVPDGEGEFCLVDSVYDNGIAKTLRIKTFLGTEIEAVPEHRIWVMGENGEVGWKFARDMKVGDFICHSRHNMECGFGKDKPYSEDQFLLWGFYVGDGCVTKTQRGVIFTVEATEERYLVESLIFRVCNKSVFAYPKKKKDGTLTNGVNLVVQDSRYLRGQWRFLGFGYDVKKKGVPLLVRTASRRQQAAFLRGLFESDGSSYGNKIAFVCKWEELSKQVQLMLLSFGIVSSRRTTTVKGKPYWRVMIQSNRDRVKFREEIGFMSDRKNEKCLKASSSEIETDSIPHQKEWLWGWYRDLKNLYPSRSVFRDDFKYPMLYGDLTISRLEKLLAKLPDRSEYRDHFQKLYDSDYYYSEVVEIGEGESRTRDLCVPESHRYVASGMITHNSSLAHMLAGYFCYRLSKKYNPQAYYQVKQDQAITMTLIATSGDQAEELLAPTRAAIKRTPILRRFLDTHKNRGDSIRRLVLNTAYNIDHGLDAESGIKVTALPCSAKSTRGPANILGILEEFGFFMSHLQKTKSNTSDKEIYTAIAPSTADLVNPDTGDPDGLVFIPSTPLTTESYMYEIEQMIWERKSDLTNSFVIHLPSWWTNPLLPTVKLKEAYALDPPGFWREYGANYTEQLENALDRPNIELCRVDPGDHRWIQSGEETYMGFDMGLKKDWTVISIIAMNGEGQARLIHHEPIGFDQTPGWEAYVDERTHTSLDVVKIAARIDYLWGHWNVRKGLGDQYNSFGLNSHLKSGAREFLDLADMSQPQNDRIARNFLAYIQMRKITVYFLESEWKNDLSLLREFARIKKLVTGGTVPKIKLVAPAGWHDDQYSAVSRSLFVGQEDIAANPPLARVASPSMIRHSQTLRAEIEQRTRSHPAAVRNIRPTGRRMLR